jgi:hypothetical protein
VDEDLLRQFEEAHTFIGRMAGRAYRAMFAAAVKEGLPEEFAQRLVGPYVVKQMLAAVDRQGLPDPEANFLSWLRDQADDPE